MKARRILLSASLWTLLIAAPALAIDEGQTIPKLNSATIVNPNTTVNLIPSTNGEGNLKGIHCLFDSSGVSRNQPIDITIDGTTTTILVNGSDYPREASGAGKAFTGFMPMNLRFESSIQVVLKRFASPAVSYSVTCVASWALD